MATPLPLTPDSVKISGLALADRQLAIAVRENLDEIVVDAAAAGGAAAAAAAGPAIATYLDDNGKALPAAASDDSYEVTDKTGKAALSVNVDGSTNIGSMRVEEYAGTVFEDLEGKVIFGWTPQGEPLGKLAGSQVISRTVIIPCLGQSNEVSMALPAGPEIDLEDSRIWQLPYGASTLQRATVPLLGQGNATGPNTGLQIAKEFLKENPESFVVLVPAAVGGTGLALTTTSPSGVWSVDYTGPYRLLFETAVAMTINAHSAAVEKWGTTPTYLAATWVQGGQDASDLTSRATYETELDKLITTFRERIGSQIPFVIGGMVPEWVEQFGTAPRADIRKAHLDTPRRVERTAYADGIRNGGGALGTSEDLVHYTREGIIRLGKAMYRELPRAQNNVTASKTTIPLDLTATVWNGELEATWTAPACRVTGYEVQTSPNGTDWTTHSHSEPMEARHVSSVSAPVMIRVRATGPATQSMYTTPVKAIGV